MGGGASKNQQRLQCPSGYDPEKFKQLMANFDRMDADGEHAFVGGECQALANENIVEIIEENKLALIQTKLTMEQKLKVLELQKAQEHVKIDNLHQEKLKNLRQSFENMQTKISQKTDRLQHMTEADKLHLLHDTMTDSEHGITFWEYFEFMKDRTLN